VRFSLCDSVSATNLASIDDASDGHPADRKCIEYTGALSSHFMFAALDQCENILSKQCYIAGNESDIRLFVTSCTSSRHTSGFKRDSTLLAPLIHPFNIARRSSKHNASYFCLLL
jgi:hypothetical protein